MSTSAPAYGVQIICTYEDSPRYGRTAWIDFEDLEDEEQADLVIGELTGRSNAPYPDSWIDDGTYEVNAVYGLGPRLAAMASDDEMQGLMLQTWVDLAIAIQQLDEWEVAPFLAWADTDHSWLPGYDEMRPPDDAVLWFRCCANASPPGLCSSLEPAPAAAPS